MLELALIIPAVSLTLDTLYSKNSKSFRTTLKLLLIFFPSASFAFYSCIIDGNISQNAFLGLFLVSLALITKGYLEFGIVVYTFAYNINVVALWILPIMLIYMTIYYIKEGIKDGMLNRKINMQEINALFNKFTTVTMAMLACNVFIWIPVLVAEDSY
jgi:cadmium resistance protein CadD (predicted permease)